MNKSYLIRRFR